MRLAEFIATNREAILRDWEEFARTLLPAARGLDASALRDDAEAMLAAIAEDMRAPQSEHERTEKSKGRGSEHRLEQPSRSHASGRVAKGFRLDQLVAEYRALRASVLRLWSKGSEDPGDVDGVTRFNEAIDEALAEATKRFTEALEHYRSKFLGILGHDLRDPLNGIVLASTLLTASDRLQDEDVRSAMRISSSAKRMSRMVSDLLDFTRSRLGEGIPVRCAPTDLGAICRQVVAELEALHPEGVLRFSSKGDVRGEWDADRLAQVIGNLVGNALQYGAKGEPVTVTACDAGVDVLLEVHNGGRSISPAAMITLFDPMVRHSDDDGSASTSLGLGLFIAEQIVGAHDGRITVMSTDEAGTTFTVRVPRRSQRLQQCAERAA